MWKTLGVRNGKEGQEAVEGKTVLYCPKNIPFLNHHFCFHSSKIAAMMWQPVNGCGGWGSLSYLLSVLSAVLYRSREEWVESNSYNGGPEHNRWKHWLQPLCCQSHYTHCSRDIRADLEARMNGKWKRVGKQSVALEGKHEGWRLRALLCIQRAIMPRSPDTHIRIWIQTPTQSRCDRCESQLSSSDGLFCRDAFLSNSASWGGLD